MDEYAIRDKNTSMHTIHTYIHCTYIKKYTYTVITHSEYQKNKRTKMMIIM